MTEKRNTKNLFKQYDKAVGDEKIAIGLELANHLWFVEFDERKARNIISELNGIQADDEKSMAQKVREWVDVTEMPFRITQIFDALQSVTDPKQKQRDRNAIRQIMHRLKKDGVVQDYGNVEGGYRKVDDTVELLNPRAASKEGIKFHLPFGMNDMGIKIFNGNIITITGEKSAGKTGLCMALAKHNRHFFKTRYISSEMWDAELGDRQDLHDDISPEEWDDIQFVHRTDNFADIIVKNWLNIIDYMELKQGALFEVGDKLTEIHDALGGTGVAVVALQLDPGKDVARGGPSSLDKPRLILNLKKGSTKKMGTLKIYDAKNLKRGVKNPSGKIKHFKLKEGTLFVPQGVWHYEDECSEETCGMASKNGVYS